MARKEPKTSLKAPYLKKIWLDPARAEGHEGYPLDIPVIAAEPFEIEFTHAVTLLVGPNGSGKSTILEAIAALCGFGAYGGSRNYQVDEDAGDEHLSQFLRAAWLPKVANGFYTRAETIFSLVRQMDMYGADASRGMRDTEDYGEKSLLQRSHGEGYSAIFRNKVRDHGVYLFDEPEAALSPAKQIDFVKLLHEKEKTGYTQFIIATHSPFLMAYPGACVLHMTPRGIVERSYKQTENFKILQEFYYDPTGFMKRVFEGE
jgi:predicted ATPase